MKQPRLHIDAEICLACRNCEIMCSLKRYGGVNPRRARIHLSSDRKNGIHKPQVCRHCKKPFCMDACPAGAFVHNPDLDIFNVDQDLCTGCGSCVAACPFASIWLDPVTGKALKCDLCGGDPQCLTQCRTLAHYGRPTLTFGVRGKAED